MMVAYCIGLWFLVVAGVGTTQRQIKNNHKEICRRLDKLGATGEDTPR